MVGIYSARLREEFATMRTEAQVPALERCGPGRQEADRHLGLFAEYVERSLHPHLDKLSKDLDVTGAAGSINVPESLFLERVRKEILRPVEPLQIIVGNGCRLSGTPYDLDWSVGGGMGFLGRFDGSVSCFGIEGCSAAGLGFYLSTDKPVDLAITPNGTYKYSCAVLSPDVRDFSSIGGLGVTIYRGSKSQPTYSRQIELWRVRGAFLPDGHYGKVGQGDTGSILIADATPPGIPGGFGMPALAPVFTSLQPGIDLLVWIWIWQISVRIDGVFSGSYMKMPAVTICGGPSIGETPIVVH